MNTWVKSTSGEWLDLLGLNLSGNYFVTPRYGVYAIWYKSPAEVRVMKIGQGNLAERLAAERTNPEILKFAQLGPLKVSWVIENDSTARSGMEAFLAEKYLPILDQQRYDPLLPRITVSPIA